jgi:hypothetical protein
VSTLLLELVGDPTFNRTIWPVHIKIYDDLIIYKKRTWFILREITISYNQIARVTLSKGLLFGFLEIETTGADKIVVKYVSKTKANQAKAIIDQKIYRSHAKHNPGQEKESPEIATYEKSVSRLKELLNRGSLTVGEFERKKKELLKKIR